PAAAGTELAEPYSRGAVIIVPRKRSLQPEGRHPPRGVARSGLRPLTKIPCCCLPYESGPCLSPSLAVCPHRPATRHWLGRPLPHQPPDGPRATLPARLHAFLGHPSVCGISSAFALLSPTRRHVPT